MKTSKAVKLRKKGAEGGKGTTKAGNTAATVENRISAIRLFTPISSKNMEAISSSTKRSKKITKTKGNLPGKRKRNTPQKRFRMILKTASRVQQTISKRSSPRKTPKSSIP